MKEYKIKITGGYDVIVLSPEMIARLIRKVRNAGEKELVIPAEEILPQGYAGYLARVLEANVRIAEDVPEGNPYALTAEQIEKLQFDEKDCFDRAGTGKKGSVPQFEVKASEAFYMVTKRDDNRFFYVFQDENGEEAGVVLEYL